MKKWLLLIFGLALAPPAMAQKGPALAGDWKPVEVTAGVYVIHGPLGQPSVENQGFMNNPAFLLGPSGVIVVDPGASVQIGEMLLERIAAVTDLPVVAVFNTHVHGDHWLGNQAIVERYPEARIYGHERLLARVEAGAGAFWLELMARLTEGATAGTRVVAPTSTVVDGDAIDAAGLRIEILHVDKAHTDSDIMVWVPVKGVVFLGDNAGAGRVLRIDGGSYRGNVEALERAAATGARVFVPGHGNSGDLAVVTGYRSFLAQVYATVSEGYEEGLADFEIRPRLLPKLGAWTSWADFDGMLGPHISGAYLEAEAAAFE